jgi:predicted HTH transcriptional regulator
MTYDIHMPDFTDIILQGRETSSVEYKSPVPWSIIDLKVAKTAMAMSNLQDGGFIVIGVAEPTQGVFDPVGLTPSDLATFTQDGIQARVNDYARPNLSLAVHVQEWNGRMFVVIAVATFTSVPTICERDSNETRRGALYVRSARMAETSEVRSSDEMRAIIDLATEKRLKDWLGLMGRVGIPIDRLRAESAAARFAAEMEDLI